MSSTNVLRSGTNAPPPSSVAAPTVRLPERAFVFTRRADRLEQLANGHAGEAFLRFMAEIMRAQQSALARHPAVPLPAEGALALARAHQLPPLSVQGWWRDPAWHATLHHILDTVAPAAPAPLRALIGRVRELAPNELEQQASALLDYDYANLDRGAAPFLGAALQVYWTHMAALLPPNTLERLEPPTLCPCCGSLPAASLVRIGGSENSLRYLHCSLCATEWNLVRITCAHCQSTKGIHYYHVEGGRDAVKAEACDNCQSYLKIFYLEKDSNADAIADDLASMALDLLVADAGFQRAGANPLFIPGDAAHRPSTAGGPRLGPIGDETSPPGS